MLPPITEVMDPTPTKILYLSRADMQPPLLKDLTGDAYAHHTARNSFGKRTIAIVIETVNSRFVFCTIFTAFSLH